MQRYCLTSQGKPLLAHGFACSSLGLSVALVLERPRFRFDDLNLDLDWLCLGVSRRYLIDSSTAFLDLFSVGSCLFVVLFAQVG